MTKKRENGLTCALSVQVQWFKWIHEMITLKPQKLTVSSKILFWCWEKQCFLLTSAKNTAHECDHHLLLEIQLQFNTMMTSKMYLQDTYKDIYLLWQWNSRKKFFSKHLFQGLFLKFIARINVPWRPLHQQEINLNCDCLRYLVIFFAYMTNLHLFPLLTWLEFIL